MTVRTFEYLFGPTASVFWPGVIAAVAVALAAGLLSPLVVVRRLAFVGQGVSHAAFAGLGLALVVTWATGGAVAGAGLTSAMLMLVSLGAGALMARLSSSAPGTNAVGSSGDTAIGVVMVAGMAIGFLLTRLAAGPVRELTGRTPPDLESVMFGSVVSVSWLDAWLTVVVCAAVVLAAWWHRRAIVLWAIDEEGAEAFGVRTSRVRLLTMLLLSVLVVMAVRVAGVVLATAVLVLPGAAALRCSRQFSGVLVWSVALSVGAVAMGGIAAFELDLPPGPAIVLAGVVLWMLAASVARLSSRV